MEKIYSNIKRISSHLKLKLEGALNITDYHFNYLAVEILPFKSKEFRFLHKVDLLFQNLLEGLSILYLNIVFLNCYR